MKLLVLDGNSILNRSFYGIKVLTNKEGQYTNAIYGFLTTLSKLKGEINPDAIAIAFDMKAPTFRHKIYKEYKGKRKGMPDELASQLPILKKLLKFLGYNLIECEGFEADDILGTLAKSASKSGDECVIATGDRDSFQLVSENVTVRMASTKFGKAYVELYDINKIREVYGVSPKELIEIKSIQGDTSDNIPGVKGIGQKGAGELIRKFHSIDYIYDNINELDIKDGLKKKLIDGKDLAFLSKVLGTIRTDAPIDTDIKKYVVSDCDRKNALDLMTSLELFSLIDKILPQDQSQNSDIQENFVNEMFVCNGKTYNLNKDKFEDVKNVLESESLQKYTSDSKFVFSWCYEKNVDVKNISFDTMLASYLLNPSDKSYDVDTLLNKYAAKTFEDLVKILNDKILECNQSKLLFDVEIPLAKILARMEKIGFSVDCKGIEEYRLVLSERMSNLQNEIFKYVGYEFNVNSTKQLSEALFDKLCLPTGKKNKSGYSTNAEVLESMRSLHPVIELILSYRSIMKLKSTYCDGMLKVVAKDGRIHTSFNQTETRTGRISSSEPNLQNIPVRTKIGRQMRKFFQAKEGCVLVDADYSQIELRILACIADDENMKQAFKNNLDIHKSTASQIFNLPQDMISSQMRNRAKTINFGIIYGMSAFSLSKDIGTTRKQAQDYIDSYFKHYSQVKKYLDGVLEKAKKNGYVETIFGRRRYLPELYSSNYNVRSFAERVTMNMPIQGSSADIIKIAMIKVSQRLKKENLKSELILQVHDELIVEAPENEAEYVKVILEEEMSGCVNMAVPLTVEAGIGKTWYDVKK